MRKLVETDKADEVAALIQCTLSVLVSEVLWKSENQAFGRVKPRVPKNLHSSIH